MAKWQRSFFQPVLPLGEDGRRVTGSKEHIALSRMAAGEGMVLLKNEKNTLPIRRGTKVAFFGKGTVDYVKGGGGSGDVTVEYIRNLYEGMKIKEDEGKVEVFDKLAKYYEKDIQKQYADGAVPGMTVEPELPDELLNEAREYTDTAVITICRFSGEGWDRKCEAAQDGYVLDGEEKRNSELSAKIFENGDFCLTNAENAMVEKVKKAFPHVIVVMNVGGIVDTKWFRDCDEIQSVLMAWQGGMEGGLATADILCGDVNPSGKLSDTYAKDLEDYPSTANFHESAFYVDYTEDIYVGYRYFDTFDVPVRYGFGYGLSYTEFEISDYSLESVNDGKIKVSAQVKNIGEVSGKEVVQIYVSLSGGILEKEAHRLAAYAKTSELKPGESEKVSLEISVDQLTSYDEKRAAWILENGFYGIWIGNSLASAKLCGGLKLDKEVLLRQVKNLFPLKQELEEMVQEAGNTTARERAAEQQAQKENLTVVELHAEDFTTEVVEYKKNNALYEKEAMDFVDTLSEEELIDLAAGDPGKAQGGNLGPAGISVHG